MLHIECPLAAAEQPSLPQHVTAHFGCNPPAEAPSQEVFSN